MGGRTSNSTSSRDRSSHRSARLPGPSSGHSAWSATCSDSSGRRRMPARRRFRCAATPSWPRRRPPSNAAKLHAASVRAARPWSVRPGSSASSRTSRRPSRVRAKCRSICARSIVCARRPARRGTDGRRRFAPRLTRSASSGGGSGTSSRARSTRRSSRLCEEAVREETGQAPRLPSGPVHDATEMAALMPAVMLFAASPNGLSHCREEDTPDDVLEQAIRAYVRLVGKTIEYVGRAV